jgi:hypothetical protein
MEPRVFGDGTRATYEGKFGNRHLITFQEWHLVSREHLDLLDEDLPLVARAVHELIHQKHAEVLGDGLRAFSDGSPIAPFNAVTTSDPWEVAKLSEQYKAQRTAYLEQLKQADPDAILRGRLYSHIAETAAYLGQAEVFGNLNYTVHMHADAEEAEDESEHRWVMTFAGMAPVGQRAEIIHSLMHVDSRQFNSLSHDQLEQLLQNPAMVLQYTVTEAA